jgi:hypothetical protein
MSYERRTKKETQPEAEITALRENVDALRMPAPRQAGSQTAISRGLRNCASAAAPAHRSAPADAIHIEERDAELDHHRHRDA